MVKPKELETSIVMFTVSLLAAHSSSGFIHNPLGTNSKRTRSFNAVALSSVQWAKPLCFKVTRTQYFTKIHSMRPSNTSLKDVAASFMRYDAGLTPSGAILLRKCFAEICTSRLRTQYFNDLLATSFSDTFLKGIRASFMRYDASRKSTGATLWRKKSCFLVFC